ncbi:MAG: putative transposase, partial [Gammaproteobacteria bacterium]
WLYLAVVLYLFSRKVIGFGLLIVFAALLMAVWRQNSTAPVTVHTDQGSQYTSHDW